MSPKMIAKEPCYCNPPIVEDCSARKNGSGLFGARRCLIPQLSFGKAERAREPVAGVADRRYAPPHSRSVFSSAMPVRDLSTAPSSPIRNSFGTPLT
jgi:hypothetical protein